MSINFTGKIALVSAGSTGTGLATEQRFVQERTDQVLLILNFTREWNKWYRVLRYGKRFGLFDSLRYGLWLARDCA